MRFLSGVQPSGELHLGNYFGAIKQHIELQDQGEALYFIANFHALTTVRDAALLEKLTRDVALDYLALGLDPDKAILFRQSDVPEVLELAWVLGTVTGMGVLERATSYKDKVARGLHTNVGLFTYPVLMAADILIYKSDVVPVGADQVQHIEMTQDMAQSFNAVYGEVFKRPEGRLNATAKVPGTDGQKMSKSYGNTIPIFAAGKKLKKIIGGIVTDSTDYTSEPLDPDACTVFALYELFADDEEKAAMRRSYIEDRAFGYGHAKMALRDKVDAAFSEARERRAALEKEPQKVEAILMAGAGKARELARETLREMRAACGIPVPKSF